MGNSHVIVDNFPSSTYMFPFIAPTPESLLIQMQKENLMGTVDSPNANAGSAGDLHKGSIVPTRFGTEIIKWSDPIVRSYNCQQR